VRFSDFLSPSRLHRLALYQEFFRRQGIESQLAFRTSSGPAYFAGIALSRGPGRPDFTERDRLCLDLLRPHLVQAYRTARALSQSRQELEGLRRAAAMVGVGAIRLGRSGRVTIVAEPVRTWLAEYFGHRSTERRPLPDDLRRWLRQEEATLTGSGDVPASRRPIVIEGDGRRLIVRLATDPAGSVLVFEERRAALAAEPLRRFGLSHRQTEVLRWVAQGKTNPEIASILGTSPRTVGKHLEHVYAKLGVETRTAAAAMALTAHTDPDPSS
jgi:DNA-binding CsgD family transcriptional regulator